MKGYFRKRQNGKWSFTVDVGTNPATGRRIQKSRSGFQTKKEAQAACAELVNEVEKGLYRQSSNVLISDFYERFVRNEIEPNFETSTIEGYWKTLRYIVRPYWGHVLLQDITPMMISDLYHELSKKYKPGSLKLFHGHLKRVLRTAYLWGIIKTDPCVVSPPKTKRSTSSENYWTMDECLYFLEQTKNDTYHLVYKLAIWSGMRRGEILGLSHKDVDFKNDCLRVRQQLVTQDGTVTLKKKLKSESSARDVPLPDDLMKELKEYTKDMKRKRMALGIRNEHDLVFLTARGKWVHPNQINKLFRERIKSLEMKHISFHGLRHSSATMLSEMKESVHAISQRLGHASPTITNEMYVHLTEKMKQDLSSKLTDYYNEKNQM